MSEPGGQQRDGSVPDHEHAGTRRGKGTVEGSVDHGGRLNQRSRFPRHLRCQRVNEPRRGHQQVGGRAISVESELVVVQTAVRGPSGALRAAAAGHQPLHHHARPGLDPGSPGHHAACPLVAEDDRVCDVLRVDHPIDDVEVGTAHPHHHGGDHHLVAARDRGGAVFELDLMRCSDGERSHQSSASRLSPPPNSVVTRPAAARTSPASVSTPRAWSVPERPVALIAPATWPA